MNGDPGFIDMGRWPYGWTPSGPGWDYPEEPEEPEEDEGEEDEEAGEDDLEKR